MKPEPAEKIATAVLYEGYLLYPYRPSAVKNRKRFNFGVLSPAMPHVSSVDIEPQSLQTECLAWTGPDTLVDVKARFLNLRDRRVYQAVQGAGENPEEMVFQPGETLELEGQVWYSWQEGVERKVETLRVQFGDLVREATTIHHSFPKAVGILMVTDSSGQVRGKVEEVVPEIRVSLTIRGQVLPHHKNPANPTQTLGKITVVLENQTPCEPLLIRTWDDRLTRSLISAHTILGIQGGSYISLLDPPAGLQGEASACHNQGVWPVLVGEPGSSSTVLGSPIILYDYPQIAPESVGDFYDGTEIDEMLALRVMALTDEEKQEMRTVDERARLILERTEALSQEHLMRLHGVLRKEPS
ncbi:MAG: hypothetical protein K1Y36_28610 [Blastocatellia bacterium]|nr:hypothetical protein [Blastocatellia bacterium]